MYLSSVSSYCEPCYSQTNKRIQVQITDANAEQPKRGKEATRRAGNGERLIKHASATNNSARRLVYWARYMTKPGKRGNAYKWWAKLELDDTSSYICNLIPDFANHKIIADSARPESISFLARNGLPYITGTVKGKGSVEDGIDHLKSYKKIVVHPRCTETINELKNYSYKIDRHSGEVTRDIVDLYNHYIDAIRYAFEPVMHNKSRCGFLDLL